MSSFEFDGKLEHQGQRVIWGTFPNSDEICCVRPHAATAWASWPASYAGEVLVLGTPYSRKQEQGPEIAFLAPSTRIVLFHATATSSL